MPDFWALKNFQNAFNDKTQKVGCTLFSELRICELINHKSSSFEYPKNPCLNQATWKKCLPNFTQKILELKISNPTRSFWSSLEIWSTLPPLPGTASLVSHANSAENALWQCYFHIRSWSHTPWAVESSWSCGDYHGIQLSLRCIWLE